MKKQVEVNGKIFKVGDNIHHILLGGRKIKYIGDRLYVFTYAYGGIEEENCDAVENLDEWVVRESERERIELEAYVCDGGEVTYLTRDRKFISLGNFKDSRLHLVYYPDQIEKLKGFPTIYAWADTLEYCDNESDTIVIK